MIFNGSCSEIVKMDFKFLPFLSFLFFGRGRGAQNAKHLRLGYTIPDHIVWVTNLYHWKMSEER